MILIISIISERYEFLLRHYFRITTMNRGMNTMNTKKALGIAALALGITAGAQAQNSITVEASSSANKLPADALLAGQSRVILNYGNASLIVEGNDAQNFGDKEFIGFSYKLKAGKWTLIPGARNFDVTLKGEAHTAQELSFMAKRPIGASELTLFTAGDDTGFRVGRAWMKNIAGVVDAAAGVKYMPGGIGRTEPDGSTRDAKADYALALHTKSGSAGVGVGKTINNAYGVSATMDLPDVGFYFFGKENMDTRSTFAVIQATANSKATGKRLGGQNHSSAVFPTLQVTSEQRVKPFIGAQPSPVFAGGDLVSQFAYVKNRQLEYAQAEIGKVFGTQEKKYGFIIGGRAERTEKGTSFTPTGEVAGRIPFKGGSLDLTVRGDLTSLDSVSGMASYSRKF
jgi:hypothetical protein